MIRKKVGDLVIEIPDFMLFYGAQLYFTSSNLYPVYFENEYTYNDSPIGYNLVHEIPEGGIVINGIYVDDWGNTHVLRGPLNEPLGGYPPGEAPFDTYFTPPDDFVMQVSVYRENY